MMIKDLDVHEELTGAQRVAVRGGLTVPWPEGHRVPYPGPTVPNFEELERQLKKLFEEELIPKNIPGPKVVPL